MYSYLHVAQLTQEANYMSFWLVDLLTRLHVEPPTAISLYYLWVEMDYLFDLYPIIFITLMYVFMVT